MPCLGCDGECLRRPSMPMTRFRREYCKLADGFAALDAQYQPDCARLPEAERQRCEEAARFPQPESPARASHSQSCVNCNGGTTKVQVNTTVRKPGFFRRGLTYAQAMAAYAADDFKQASEAQQAVRHAVCDACPLNENGDCLSCGCVLEKKIPIRSSSCPEGKWFRETDDHQPFSGPVRRNLIYHVYPLGKGADVWRWNLDELLKRIDLFNGRRIAGIVTGPTCAPPEAVREILAPHGFECLVRNNHKDRGELQTLPDMLSMVASPAADEITFYAHTKAVSRAGTDKAWACQQWAAMLYETCLDDIAAVERALENFAFAGACKCYGHFPVPWHYSGTFFWFRHNRVFKRHWNEFIPQRYASEAWPGGIAAHTEAACLFFDDVPFGKLYDAGYWRKTVLPMLEKWRAARQQLTSD